MLNTSDKITIGILAFLCISLIFSLKYVVKRKNKRQLENIFVIALRLLIFWMICSILQIICVNIFNVNPIYFEYFIYIPVCFIPVTLLFMALIFAKTKINFSPKYYLLFIIPTLSLLFLWTNDFHHLFYKVYSIEYQKTVFGTYFYIHSIYSYILYGISLFVLIKYSIKNSGFFSRQAILILAGALVPIIANSLATFSVIPTSVYITPITFAFTVICFSFAIFRFSLFKATPIALQRIVDRISDSYVVLNESYEISDFNTTFINTFHIKDSSNIRGKNFVEFLEENKLNVKNFSDHIEKILNNNNTEKFELYIKKIEKYFNIEITSIIVNNEFLGILVLFKDITQHKVDMRTIQDNQDILMESERLASLGQLVGGIAHNLKTPIMSISGATEGLSDLVTEFDNSIGNPIVNNDDFHEIASDMRGWLEKIKSYTEYMSDILTAVKGQAVTLNNEEEMTFTISELFKRVDILMKHELKKAVVYLNISLNIDENTIIKGNISSLVQVINNMISNSIQSYNGKPEQQIDLSVYKTNTNIIISIRDYGSGLPDKVKNKLFKEMITTKGKNGTGLGLYMSYSTIKAHFHGDITFESEPDKGTVFYIILPI